MNEVIVETRNLYVAYEDKIVLEDITFSLHRGEFWGIFGPNGSGKTTLLRAILGLVPPFSGEIRVFGKPPDELNDLRDRIGYVPQHAKLDFSFPIRVREAVLLGRSRRMGLGKRPQPEDWKAVDQALELVEIADLADRQIGRLSGGQRQRVLIARALAVEPELLLMDEPTAALDVNAAESFYEWLHSTHQKMNLTIMLVSHDISVVSRHVTAVACLNRRLVAHGLPEEVLSQETFDGMYGCDVLLFSHGNLPHMVVERVPKGRHRHD
ncbi:MAG: metal ABC transporter ATP-binding protein [candidate division KSB1 bacterium]|nr:metal ABC transporter ATP-binding protein [candidate division KSB1 bacterium]